MDSDNQPSEDFSSTLDDLLNKSMAGLCVALGSKLGIFDVMASCDSPQTSDAIAAKGNWKPRYVREWLNAMVCADIIEYNRDEETYYIPESRKPVLSKSGSSKQPAATLELIPILSSVYQELSSCFPVNGPKGILPDRYKGFHEWKSRIEDSVMSWSGLYSVMKEVPEIRLKLENGAKICDGGCSSGHFTMAMAEDLQKCSVVGMDISSHAIELAKEKAKEKEYQNLSFEVADICRLPKRWLQYFDVFLTIHVVHDLPFPKDFLKGVLAALKPGGVFVMVDSYLPSNVADCKKYSYAPWYHTSSLFHCLPISMHEEGSAALGCTWGIEKQRQYMEEAGFLHVTLLNKQDTCPAYYIGYKPK